MSDTETGPIPTIRKPFVGLEIVIVLAICFGRSALYAIISLIEKLTRGEPLADQTTTMNPSITPDRPWLDLAYQLYYFVFPTATVMLALYLLYQAYGRARSLVGFNLAEPGRDSLRALAICAAVGIPGLAFFFVARELGLNTNIVPANLATTWWTIPILIGSAIVAGVSEEVIMLGYLFTRLRTLNWAPFWIVFTSAIIRGSYHFYQGFGGFVGNLVMGAAFGWLFLRWKRVLPFVIAHTVFDIVSFVGYALLAPVISWL
ncbi:MAG: CPBP family intramembrane metalloprotease [Propionibacteriaceae bacterium]|nr:CPBP family intramembrane metalloprotease [Propionibacteriaceae bacterium]